MKKASTNRVHRVAQPAVNAIEFTAVEFKNIEFESKDEFELVSSVAEQRGQSVEEFIKECACDTANRRRFNGNCRGELELAVQQMEALNKILAHWLLGNEPESARAVCAGLLELCEETQHRLTCAAKAV